MVDTLTSFTPGDIVVSLSGAANTTGTTYTDNQGTPLTLEELTTSGAVVGQLVLPQNTAGNESAISAEYGSSSEGTLELSGDGQSLVIAGYGVNASAYNAGETGLQPTNTTTAANKTAGGTYGNNSLAQTYSVPTGGTNGAPSGVTVVPRVVADISYNGTIDTTTSLTNVFNQNNPRSVATMNGSSFYLSGQGVKGDNTTQGVFTATDGETGTPAAIYNGVDTRTAELYNGALYVSEDSSITPGKGGIYAYGQSPASGSPPGPTTPTILPGMTGTVALANGDGNSVNGSSGTVDMSPENFFFANPNTLYIADSGNPKGGSLGDGGLQKWSFNGNTWNLDYTLSDGLNLVKNTTSDPGQGGAGTTGLIGLTGQVNTTTGQVSLYATNSTVGDLNATYVYGISDTLADTTASQASGESFTQLFAAPTDSNVRGIAFAPQAATCYASGTLIATARGDVAVEDLKVGDLAITAAGASRPIVWIGHRMLDCRRGDRAGILPIRIAAHAFGEDRPARDLFVSPGHAICVDFLGETLISANALVNGTTVTQVEVDAVTYWHIELESHDILLAENLPAESFLDMGNRGFFVEGEVVDLAARVDVDSSVRTHADFCRPYASEGAIVDGVRARLQARAEMLAVKGRLVA